MIFYAGSGLNGVDEIKSHKFFDGLNWEKLANREIEPPVRPIIEHPLDTRNFCPHFVAMPAVDKPAEKLRNHERYFNGMKIT